MMKVMEEAVFLVLFSLFFVFPLWVVEQFLPWPFLIEEIFKLVIVYRVNLNSYLRHKFIFSLFIALLFGFSEAIFYLFNVMKSGSVVSMAERLLFTVPMHLITMSILYWGVKGSRIRVAAAFVIALGTHWGFNRLVSRF